MRKLLFGETNLLPISVAVLLVAGLLCSRAGWWEDAGGPLVLAGAVLVLTVTLRR